MAKPALFLDRDGTLMEEVHYCRRPEDVRVFPGTAHALRQAREAGWLTILITNQSGIGRNIFSEAEYHAVHAEFLRQIEGELDAAYYCPDAPDQASNRRKPAPGMILQAAEEHPIDLAHSWMIGDKDVDIACGRAVGVNTLLVKTGYGQQHPASSADRHASDILEAIEWILRSAPAKHL